MKFIDLQHQYLAYRPEIDARMRGVIEHAQFIMGPEIQELEDVLAARPNLASEGALPMNRAEVAKHRDFPGLSRFSEHTTVVG